MPQSVFSRRIDSRRAAILYQLWKEGPISRGTLAERMSLNLPMVSACVQELIKEGVLIEEGYATSTGGRKAQLLDVNPKRGGVAAVEFSSRGILSASADMKGRLFNHIRKPFDFSAGPKAAISAIFEAVEYQKEFLAEDEGLKLERIGIVTSGPVDERAGTSISFPRFPEWRDVPIAEMVSDHFEVPAVIGNHVAATALAETVSGRFHEVPNFLYVHLGPGIGCGIVANGAVYRGLFPTIGEFGHMTADERGAPCYCGNRGCLETIASDFALVAEIERRMKAGEKSTVPQHVDDTGRINHEAIFRAADMGDKVAGETIDRAAKAIGVQLASVINLLAPTAILLGGTMAEDGERLITAIRDEVRARAMSLLVDRVRFELGSFGPQAGVTGAVALALHTHYNSFSDPVAAVAAAE